MRRFLQFCREQNEKTPVAGCNICLEVTEQAALAFNDDARAALRELRDLGFSLAIDDFSMGQTSLHYLKDNLFDVIKLDGSLIKGLADSRTYHEIVSPSPAWPIRSTWTCWPSMWKAKNSGRFCTAWAAICIRVICTAPPSR